MVASSSQVINDLLEEYEQDEIDISSLVDDVNIFELLLRVLYGYQININSVDDVTVMADKFLIPGFSEQKHTIINRNDKINYLKSRFDSAILPYDIDRLRRLFGTVHDNLGNQSYKKFVTVYTNSLNSMSDYNLNVLYCLNHSVQEMKIKQIDLEDGLIWPADAVIPYHDKLYVIHDR
jgi:hypothetical protein